MWWPDVVLQGLGGHQPDYDELLAIASANKHNWTIFQEEQLIMRTNYLFMFFMDNCPRGAIELDKLLTRHLRFGNKIPTIGQVRVLAEMLIQDDDSGSD